MKKVFIVILNFNGFEDTITCLKSLSKLRISRDINIEPLVIDNGSSNDSVDKISKAFPEITLIENKENLGFSGGNNEGMRYAIKSGGDYILLLNNDTIVDPDLVSELLKASAGDDVAGVVPKIYFAKGHEFHKDKYKESEQGHVIWYAGGIMDWENISGKNIGVDEVDHGQFDSQRQTDLATGCCFLIKVEILKKIGLFNDKYFLYYEDADLTQRIKSAGYKIIYAPKAILWHINAGSSGSGSTLQDYYITRNRLLFGMTYAALRTRIALLRESLKILRSGRDWQRRGARDYYFGRFGRGSFKFNI